MLFRSHVAAVASDGLIYVMSGIVADSRGFGKLSNTVLAYDSIADVWNPAPPMPEVRQDMAVTVAPDGRIFVIGGYDGQVPLNLVEAYIP